MALFILVHGSWLGAWCWREVVAKLEAGGHTARAIDLPGHGDDRFPPEAVTLEHYVQRVVDEINSIEINNPDSRPVVVGHSMGIVGQVAARIPDRIRALAYVAGLIPPAGSSLMHSVSEFDPGYLAQLQWASDRRTARISAAGFRDYWCNCCPESMVEAAFPRLTPEPAAPFETAFLASDGNERQMRRYYIECLRDRVIPLALQRSMRTSITFDKAYSIDTDHVPFFSAPDELVSILHTIAHQS